MSTTPHSPAPLGHFDAPVIKLSAGSAVSYLGPDSPLPTSENGDLAPNVTCGTYRPGHNVHWIQAGRGLKVPSTAFRLLAVEGNTLVVEHPDGHREGWQVHDTESAVAALLLEDDPVVHLHELFGLARIGNALLAPRLPHHEVWRPCDS